jgi:hypothetical protein
MIRSCFLFVLLISLPLAGQTSEFERYDWNTLPRRSAVTDTLKAINGTKILLERRIKEIYINREDIFEEINVFHQRIRVETHDAVDNNNKIYIPLHNVIDILTIKARFISPAGKITEVPQESIKELENPENKGNFKLFAMEGAEVGGEIEYFYTLRNTFDAFGTFYVQSEEPKSDVEVIFSFPSKLGYIIKSYNGFPEFISSQDSSGKTYMKASAVMIPAQKEERYSYHKAHIMRYEYTLAYNTYNSSLRIYSWSKVSYNVFNNTYKLSRTEQSAVKNAVKNLALDNKTTQEKIQLIERWIKTEVAVSEAITESPSLDQVIKYRQTSESGVTRLYVAMLNELKIAFELVMTCSREKCDFDPDFNGWNFLDDYLIYFDEYKKYIAPGNTESRMAVLPSDYQGVYGLFLHPVYYNDELASLAYEVKTLPVDPLETSSDSLFIRIECDFNQLQSHMKIHRVLSGNMAVSFQSFWETVNPDRQIEIISNVFDMGDKNTTILKHSVINGSRSDIGLRPMLWDIELSGHSLIETAGNDFIINVGKTIGTQSELYQEEARKLPVDIDFLHHYYRKIEVLIPEGFIISNPDELNMKVEMTQEGKTNAYFTSWYTLSDDKIIIFSEEVYPDLFYPIEKFAKFREVINAAADFNKKTLILTPRK